MQWSWEDADGEGKDSGVFRANAAKEIYEIASHLCDGKLKNYATEDEIDEIWEYLEGNSSSS